MSLQEMFSKIRAGWPEYRGLRKTAKAHPVHDLVVNGVPRDLTTLLPRNANFKIKGSTGAGNITAAPWVATIDPRITEKATEGFYVVYLFSVDLHRLYLSLAFGTTQFVDYFSARDVKGKLRSAAGHLQKLIPENKSLYLGPLDLAATTRDRLHTEYEQSNIAALEYDLDKLPPDAQLADDYRFMMKLYGDLVSHPLLPSLQFLFEAAVDIPAITLDPVVIAFVPRPPKKPKEHTNQGTKRFYSKSSKKVGDQGERIVYNYEVSKARRLGHNSDRVVWEAQNGSTPGWDISSIDDTGQPIQIEVKASVGKKVDGILLTANEWRIAIEKRQSFYIYLVTDVMEATPTIEVIPDPVQLVGVGQFRVEAAVWALALNPAADLSIPSGNPADTEEIAV